MPYQSRWTLSAPKVTIPSFIFDETDNLDVTVFVDATRPKSHFLTLRTFRDWSRRFAAGLLRNGLQPGNRVMLVSGNSLFTPVIVMGTLMAQGIYNSANPSFGVREFTHQIRDCESLFIIAEKDSMDKVHEAVGALAGRSPTILLFDDINDLDVAYESDTGASWKKLIATAEEGRRLEYPKCDGLEGRSRTAILTYSSGTTGLPKGVEITHSQMVSNMTQLRRTIFSDPSVLDRRALAVLPCYHGLPLLYFCFVMPKMGASTYFVERYRLETMLAHIQKFRITDLLLAPPILVAMSKNSKLQAGQVDLSSVKRIICGAAPLGLETMQSCDRIWHGSCRIRQVWGMSEAPAISLGWDELDTSTKISAAVGELLPGLEAKLMQDNGEEQLGTHPGELWIRGPNIMISYWKNPKATADTVTTDGWLKTGDIARVDKNGKWYIVDRKKELIKVRGAQVAPAELEALLLEHPQVVDAAVIGVKTVDGDEAPRAFIVARNERMVSSSEIQDFVQQRVVKQKRLDGGVVFVKVIPKTAAGKILRRLLKDQEPQQNLKQESRL